jgi:RNA binding exosome subunit
MDIHKITLRAISQATESEERVKIALSLFLSGEEMEIVHTMGHFGNPISILQASIKARNSGRFIKLFGYRLSEYDLRRLKNEICERVDDDCVLHIRFDKQAAYKGRVELANTKDAISAEIKIKAYPARPENAIAAAEKLLSSY